MIKIRSIGLKTIDVYNRKLWEEKPRKAPQRERIKANKYKARWNHPKKWSRN